MTSLWDLRTLPKSLDVPQYIDLGVCTLGRPDKPLKAFGGCKELCHSD